MSVDFVDSVPCPLTLASPCQSTLRFDPTSISVSFSVRFVFSRQLTLRFHASSVEESAPCRELALGFRFRAPDLDSNLGFGFGSVRYLVGGEAEGLALHILRRALDLAQTDPFLSTKLPLSQYRCGPFSV